MLKASLGRDRRLYMIFSITLMGVMGVASLSPAFPGVISHFQISPQQVGLLIAAFTLPGIVMTPVTGILADRFGRKAILVPSLLLFALAGSACYFAESYSTLIALRFFQGLGASCLGTLNVTLIGDYYEMPARQTVMGYNAGVLSLGTATYPLIGGLLAAIGWNFPFLLPLLALPVAIWLWISLPEKKAERHQLKSYFANVWHRINKPNVWMLFLLTFFVFMILYGSLLTYVPILMKQRMNAGPKQIGMIMSLMSLVTAALASQSGRISRRLRPERQMLLSATLYIIAILIYWKSNSLTMLVFPSVLFGMGHGMILPCIQTRLVSLAPLQERAAFMSANSMMNRTGQTLGPLYAGFFYTLAGLTGVFLSGAVLILIMGGIAVVLGMKGKSQGIGNKE